MNRIEREGTTQAGGDEHVCISPDDASAVASEVIDIVDAPPVVPHAPLSQGEVRTIVIALVLNMFLTALDQTIVATALPTIGQEFRDVSNLSWIITAYLLASTAVAPVYGTLSDIYGRRAMIVTATGLFLVGSVFCALAPNLLTLVLARALQGIGGGGILPLVQTVVADIVSPRERGRYQGYFSGVWVAAGIGGPVLGGLIAEHLHWSVIFWVNLPLGLFSLALLLPKMKKIPVYHRRRKVDWLGGVLLMASAVTLLLVLTWGGHQLPWLSTTTMAMIGSAIVLALAFVWHAHTAPEPFLPIPLLSGPVVPFAMLAGSFAVAANIAMTVHLPLYYETVYRLSATESGLALIPLVAVAVLGAWITGHAMVKLTRYKRPAIVGSLCSALAAFVLAVATPLPLWAMLLLLSIFAFGLGTGFPLSIVSIQNAVARAQVGTATGALNFFRSLMASFAVAMFSTILLTALGRDISIGEHVGGGHYGVSEEDMVSAFRYVFACAGVFLALGGLLWILMDERPLAGPARTPPADMAE